MTKIVLAGIVALLPLLTLSAQEAKTNPANAPEQGISKDLGEAILNELRQIHALLEKQQGSAQGGQAQETAKISAAGFSIGNEDAPLTLVEFADYQCPFCRQFHSVVYDRLKSEYIDSGKLRFVSRDLPLEIHPNALAAANAGRCAAEQNRFWPMRETLIAHADKLEPEAIETYAQKLGLKMDQFRSCLASAKYLASIRADIAEANSVGITGTPSFVLGKESGGRIEGLKLVGAQPYEVFAKLLTQQLNR
jgi:protein-disulfide isomerase